jgi:hypothetical protein
MTLREFHLISNTKYKSAFSRREAPEVCVSLSLKQEGAGNAGCALHPRSRVQMSKENAHEHTGSAESNPTFPAQWLYGLWRALPGVSGFLAPVASRKPALWPGRAFAPPKDLTPTSEASGPHVFAVRFNTARQHVPRPLTEFIPPAIPLRARCRRVHHIPSQRSVTMANAPSSGTGWRES